jgi:hypothetical protein
VPIAQASGRISADQVLTLDAVRTELGLGIAAMREARRKGLKVRRIGRRKFVFGADLIDFLRAASDDANAADNG